MRKKTLELTIHENKVIEPIEEIPTSSEFKGYQDYTVQELLIRPHNIRYRLALCQTPTGEYLRGKLPEDVVKMGHFGPILKSYLLYQYHHCHVTQPLLLKMMEDWGIDIWIRTVKSNLSRRQRTISHRKARDFTSRLDCINLH